MTASRARSTRVRAASTNSWTSGSAGKSGISSRASATTANTRRSGWRERRVSVIVQCKDRGAAEGGIALLCAASRIGDRSRLKGDAIGPPTVLPENGQLTLPRDRPCPIKSAPLPNRHSSHEAIIVIGSGERLGVEDLAPPFCHDPDAGAPAKPVSGDAFLRALSELDLGHAAASVLPYR